MIEKLITAFYLAVSTGIVITVLWTRVKVMRNEAMIRRLMAVFCSAYVVALVLIFVKMHKGDDLITFVALLLFAPLLWIVLYLYQKGGYQGSLKFLILALVLTAFGLVTQYTLGKSSGGLLARLLMTKETPTALNQFVFSAVSIITVSSLFLSGWLEKAIDWAEKHTSYLFWGALSFGLLVLPLFFGARIGRTSSWVVSNSIQTSEFVLKGSFAVFIVKYLSGKPMLMLRVYPAKEVMKVILSCVCITFLFFIFPLVFLQRELGTTLLLGISLVVMLTFATRKLSLFFIGIGLIASTIAIAACIHEHTAERIIGTYLEWRDYAFTPYHEGGRYWAGWQTFLARAAFKGSSLWGVGLASGYPGIIPQVSTDMISVALVEQAGVIALALVLFVYMLFMAPVLDSSMEPDFRGTLLVGMIVVLITQAFYNLSAAMNILPSTGIPLPFLSNGGSSIVSNWLIVGVMMSLIDNKKTRGSTHEND
ncbi:MAG: Lipid II flippase FtsW [Syntrophorhabdaceae bacterium PtaU1.Bin034]|nr:MAG: Lipid II flippase FtsW [Syntrophorhabdaceae bacterium PtaU1.Bin034]